MSTEPEKVLSAAEKKALKEERKLGELQQQKQASFYETVKVVCSFVVLIAGFVAFYVVPEGKLTYTKAVFPVASSALFVLMILFWCNLGKRLIRYIKDSYVELKKVVWPPRNEAVRQTFFVLAFVAVLAGFAGLCDWALVKIIYRLILGVGA